MSEIAVKKHFVRFFSPGTFVAETSEKPVDEWDVDTALVMARGITERYNATPYAFQFVTYGRSASDLDSREIARSPLYWLGGTIRTIDEVRASADPDERIILRNMEGNGWDRIITNNNSWKWTQPFKDGDVLLDFHP